MMSDFRRRIAALTATAFLSGGAHAGLPVIPGAAGFGIDTPAGRGGKIFRVTNVQASGPGSLLECIDASGPRICIFETSGVIRLTSDLKINNPYLTIAGQTAPAPGIVITGAGLRIRASDVLVQHISVRPGDAPDGPDPGSRDALRISAPAGSVTQNVVVDHGSFSWSTDEILEIWDGADNVTLSNNIFAEPLRDSIHPQGFHAFAALIGSNAGRVSMVGNLLAHSIDRNPRTAAAQFVFVNNVVYNHGSTGAFLFNKGSPTLSSLAGNTFIKGPSSSSKAVTIRLSGGDNTLVQGTKIFLKDNVGDRPDGSPGSSDPWSLVSNESGLSRSALESSSPPAWPADLVAYPAAGGEVLPRVLSSAGSRPAERSEVDARIVGDVRNGTGRMINCVANDGTARCSANGGGWPVYAENRRALTVPANPHGDDNGNGYTNVEEWLHMLAAQVEGRSNEAKPLAPVVNVQ